ncbi:MAG: hypothetical protein N2Z62_04465 [Rhodobacteraceae bacterium]|nr:hypothetical protein [Paracoccaceae bacterium]
MMPALLIAAMFAGAVSVGAAMAASAPLWLALLAYPTTGSVLLLSVVLARLALGRPSRPQPELAIVPTGAGTTCPGH